MRTHQSFKMLCIGFGVAMIAGCADATSMSPASGSLRTAAHSLGGVPSFLEINGKTTRHVVKPYSCPATGSLEYVSVHPGFDVYVFAGKFAGQNPCGVINQGIADGPAGLFVNPATHDLYVANPANFNILVFHRGQTKPFNRYSDPNGSAPTDVAVARDGTVVASDNCHVISTWIEGADGGTFVGDFPTNCDQGTYLTVRNDDTVYFDGADQGQGGLWKVRCPAGVCGVQTLLGVPPDSYYGLAIDDTGDLIAVDFNVRKAETFELPNPNPKTFHLNIGARAAAISEDNKHFFVADASNNDAAEYSYPFGDLVGTVPDPNSKGAPDGIAVDL
jgi:hypothetical protein